MVKSSRVSDEKPSILLIYVEYFRVLDGNVFSMSVGEILPILIKTISGRFMRNNYERDVCVYVHGALETEEIQHLLEEIFKSHKPVLDQLSDIGQRQGADGCVLQWYAIQFWLNGNYFNFR